MDLNGLNQFVVAPQCTGGKGASGYITSEQAATLEWSSIQNPRQKKTKKSKAAETFQGLNSN